MVNLMQHTQATCSFTPRDMFLQQSSIGFDMTLAEIWLPLSVGASILPAEARAQQDGPRLLCQISRHPVTVICPVPSELFMWLESGLTRSQAPSVRWLMTGAEALSPALLSRAQAALPGVRTLNMYGPTEVRYSILFFRQPCQLPAVLQSVLGTSALCNFGITDMHLMSFVGLVNMTSATMTLCAHLKVRFTACGFLPMLKQQLI